MKKVIFAAVLLMMQASSAYAGHHHSGHHSGHHHSWSQYSSGDGFFQKSAGGDVSNINSDNPVSVPEPSSLALMGIGLVGLAVARKRNRK